MARSRTIKPSFFTNDELAECSPMARLMFAGLWTLADRKGRLPDRPKKIKAELFPYDDCDCDKLAMELQGKKFIRRYKVDDKAYIEIVNFVKHQNPHPKEQASIIPDPLFLADNCDAVEINGEPFKGDDLQCSSFLQSIPSFTPLPIPSYSAQPVRNAFNLYNEFAEKLGLPVAQRLTPSREKRLKARLGDAGGLEGWNAALLKLSESAFCKGENDQGWKADLDFVLQESSFTKLIEGSYAGTRKLSQKEKIANDTRNLIASFTMDGAGQDTLDENPLRYLNSAESLRQRD